MTQEDLAASAGIHTATLSRIERGAIDPLWSTVRHIAAALGVSVAQISQRAETLESAGDGGG